MDWRRPGLSDQANRCAMKLIQNCMNVCTLCTTKIKRLKFSKSQTGSDVSVQLAS
jgi:hypothetical protein